MTSEVLRLVVGLALAIALVAAMGWAVTERAMRLGLIEAHRRERVIWRKQLAALANVLTVGTPTPVANVEPEREPSAEERAVRHFSEESVQRGVERLRQEYAAAGIPVEEEVLRAEAISMLNGLTPEAAPVLVRD